jgi:putative membrane protein insertion efficiency factor
MRIALLFIICFFISILSSAQVDVNSIIQRHEQELDVKTNRVFYIQKDDWKNLTSYTLGALLLLQAYKSFISSDLGSDCKFNPTCSAFSAAVIRQNGFLSGILLTADRLIRCNQEAEFEHSQHLINKQTGKIDDEVADY